MATASSITADLLSFPRMLQAAETMGLVARAKAGDGSACHDLFKAHAKRVYSLSLRLAGEKLDAENLTRDIFLAAFANLGAIHNDEAFAVELSRQSAKTVLARYSRRGVNEPAGQRLNLNQHPNDSGQNDSGQKDLPTHTE